MNINTFAKDNTIVPSMSMHTFTWGFKINSETYSMLFKLLIRNREAYTTAYYTKYTTYDYHSLGINRIEFMDYNHPYYRHLYYICFTINPRIITGKSTELYTHIVEISKLKNLPATVESTLSKLCSSIEEISANGKFRRIDYCCNLWFNCQETVEVYLYLLKQAKVPYHFEIKKFFNLKQKRKTAECYAITIVCKSYELSMYLKYPQLKAKYNNGSLNDPDELDNARGQLRIELRENRTKLLNDKKKCLCNESELLDGSNTCPRKTISKLLKNMYGTGDFMLYSDAKEEIINSRHRTSIKHQMLDVLKAVKSGHGFDPKKNGLNPNILAKIIPYFNELNLSPITLPKKKSEYCGEVIFPNPLKYITGESVELLIDTDVFQTE
mgnify:CR=1 FL=1